MKLGFVFDVRFTKYQGNYYSTNLSAELLTKRYLSVFDEMIVIGRYREVKESPIGKLVQCNNSSIEFRCVKDETPFKRLIHFRKESKEIENYLKDCDAVICRGWRGIKLCRKHGKPYLVEVVNCIWDAYWNHGFLGKIVAPVMYVIRRITTKTAPYVIYVTTEFLQKRYPTEGKCASISNVELPFVEELVLNRRIEKILNKKEDEKIVIGTAGGIDVPFKGQRFVINALAKLKKQGFTNYEYQIAGPGTGEKLKQLAEKKGVLSQIIFKGSIVHDEMFEWYDGLDIYIQPSLQEGLPRAVIEAMSRGLPCYGTKTGGIPELIGEHSICNSNRFITKQLVSFLMKHNKENAVSMAKVNFEKAKEYVPAILEKRRHDFLMEFSGLLSEECDGKVND